MFVLGLHIHFRAIALFTLPYGHVFPCAVRRQSLQYILEVQFDQKLIVFSNDLRDSILLSLTEEFCQMCDCLVSYICC